MAAEERKHIHLSLLCRLWEWGTLEGVGERGETTGPNKLGILGAFCYIPTLWLLVLHAVSNGDGCAEAFSSSYLK